RRIPRVGIEQVVMASPGGNLFKPISIPPACTNTDAQRAVSMIRLCHERFDHNWLRPCRRVATHHKKMVEKVICRAGTPLHLCHASVLQIVDGKVENQCLPLWWEGAQDCWAGCSRILQHQL